MYALEWLRSINKVKYLKTEPVYKGILLYMTKKNSWSREKKYNPVLIDGVSDKTENCLNEEF